MTAWLTGMLAIASLFMCLGLWPLVRIEIKDSREPWYRNKALRIASALWMHGLGAIVLFSSSFFSNIAETAGWALWLAWATFTIWLIAKVMIVSVSGWLKSCLAVFALWSAGCVLWALFGSSA